MSAALLSSSSSRRHYWNLLRRHVTTTTTSSPAKISSAAAKNKIRNVFDPDEALSILLSSTPSTSSSSRFAFDLTVRRLSRCGRTDDVISLLSSRRAQLPSSDESSISSLILTYGSANLLDHARQLFDEIPQPTSISFNSLLRAHAIAKTPKTIPLLFSSIPSQHPSVVPDHVSYGILLKSLCLVGKTDDALHLFDEMPVAPTVPTYTTIIDSLYKKKRSEEAERLWSDMVGKGLKPDHVLYNVKIMHSAELGRPEEVLAGIEEMVAAGWKTDAISYDYLVSAYCKAKRFDEAKDAYRGFMEKKGKFGGPNAAIFKNFVGFLCGNGDFEGGLEVVRDSMKHNKIPDFRTMRGLVEGLMKEGKVEEVKEIVRVVKERFPDSLLGGWKILEKQMGLVADGSDVESTESKTETDEVKAV